MKFGQTSTFLFGLIASITGIGTLYISLLQPSPTLTAYISYGIFYVPQQYQKQVKEINDLAKSYDIYNKLGDYDKELSYDQKKSISIQLSESITKVKKPYLTGGLHQFRSLVYFSVYNSGDAVAKNVYVELPAKALLMIEDQGGQYIHPDVLTNQYKIEHLRQKGQYRFWAWLPIETNKLNIYDIKIGNDEQVADIEYAETYSGYSALLAKNSTFVYLVLAMFMSMFFYMVYETFFSDSDSN
ncbi:hypothetical protein O1D40_003511 [Vibrio cholerae]|jgi:hypothetical protein|nr:hypothetical protein [Vibrio cholerae]EGR4144278.1 hypothetical protein [Vibrio cholerae]EKF9632126.1 hypothetical protein [Vibrio cholerae]EKF9821444.1 hypothetical protein [Vibrio cholerae]